MLHDLLITSRWPGEYVASRKLISPQITLAFKSAFSKNDAVGLPGLLIVKARVLGPGRWMVQGFRPEFDRIVAEVNRSVFCSRPMSPSIRPRGTQALDLTLRSMASGPEAEEVRCAHLALAGAFPPIAAVTPKFPSIFERGTAPQEIGGKLPHRRPVKRTSKPLAGGLRLLRNKA